MQLCISVELFKLREDFQNERMVFFLCVASDMSNYDLIWLIPKLPADRLPNIRIIRKLVNFDGIIQNGIMCAGSHFPSKAIQTSCF